MKSINFIVAEMRQALDKSSLNARHFFVCGKWLLITLLVFSFAHSMARLFWLLIPEPTLIPMTASLHQRDAVNTSDFRKAIDIHALKALALFDNPPKVTEQSVDVIPPPSQVAEETVLNVKLHGVFVSSDGAQAHAIIGQGKKQVLYRMNEELVNLPGVKLVSVLTDRVIIDNKGKSEAILLYPEGEQISTSEATHYEDTFKEQSDRGRRGNAFARGKKNQRVTDFIKVSMAREEGDIVGFRVRPGRNRQAFDDLGLQANDIVTAVNGIELTDSKVAMDVYRSMRSATEASIQVKRGDEQLNFDINMSDFEQ